MTSSRSGTLAGRPSRAALFLALSVALSAGWPASAADLHADIDLLGQVREAADENETEAPTDLYGKVGADRLWGGSSVNSYFRLERTFGQDDGASDFYAGYATVPNAVPGVEAIGGRQFISEGPGKVYVADAGRIRIDRGWPVAFTLYGGAPRYFEPTQGPNTISQDELLWGGNVRTTNWKDAQLGLGFQQWERKDKVLQQLLSLTARKAFRQLPGLPTFYGAFSYDADYQNIDLANAGVDFFLTRPRVLVNVEGGYYKPQDQGKTFQTNLNRREDTIFQGFSVSALGQARTGITIPVSRTLALRGDYSFQRYESRPGDRENGQLGSAGLTWLPGGDGLETVFFEYYVMDSDGGNVNGGQFTYQNRVYERITFQMKLNLTHYDNATNQDGLPVASFLGLTYDFLPNLSGEVNFEANSNDRFNEDFRLGFFVHYNFQHRLGGSKAAEKS